MSNMRIIEQGEISHWERRRRRMKGWRKLRNTVIFFAVIAVVGAGGYYRYQRPLPAPSFAATTLLRSAHNAPKITWPAYGQAAIGTVEDGVLAENNSAQPVPIASVSKTITALVVLNAKPLQIGQQGPAITLTAADEAIYYSYIARGGSVSGVTAGRTITQYEALQAVMLPSSNNISETLTNWAFGSQDKYIAAANKYLQKKGLTKTVVADSSGFSPQTVSTASEVVQIGIMAMQYPVLAQIVGQKEATAQVSGPITNVNRLIGINGTVGIKTGNTDEAGGCFLLAAEKTLSNGQVKTIVVAVLGAPTPGAALVDSQPLAAQVANGFRSYTAVSAGQQLGIVTTAWGAEAAALAERNVMLYGWGNEQVRLTAKPKLEQLGKGSAVGEADVSAGALQGSTAMVLSDQLSAPTASWRWQRIFSR